MFKKIAFIVLLASVQFASALTDPLKIDTGLVSGATGKNPAIRVYKGIPYATPPVGDLRWHAPLPAKAWQGVRKAESFGNICMQADYSPGPVMALVTDGKSPYTPEFYAYREPMSEDCLYINVWTPAKAATDKLPVLVYVHGGGFVQGSGAVDIYNGEGLASKGLIVVTFNYRIGIFGYFAHPELSKESEHKVSGNYGLLDQVAALQWVHKNIAAFGGDPNTVTIDGQSAGSRSINYLVATPLTHGLMQRAISQSGGQFAATKPGAAQQEPSATPPLKDTEQRGLQFGQDHHATTLAELRALPAKEIVSSGSMFRPVIDGYALPTEVYTIFATHKQNDIPMLIGWDSGDGTPFRANFGLPSTVAGYREAAEKQFGAKTDDYFKVFPLSSDADASYSQAATSRDRSFAWNMRIWARLQSRIGKNKIFLYYWDHMPPGPQAPSFGAFHSSEITYAFNNLSTWQIPWQPVDRHLAEVMSSYWVNFVKTGNPNGDSLPQWTPFDPNNEQSMLISDKVEMIPTPLKSELDFFDDWFGRNGK